MNSLTDLLAGTTGITCHSASVQPGNIFVAIRGRQTDGHHYIAAAISRGAKAIVGESLPCPAELPVPYVQVTDARHALAWLAASFYGHPSRSLSVVGVTGSNGKTTITYMLENIFREAGLKPGLIGTVRISDGAASIPSILTTPDAVSLQHYLSLMRKNGVTHAVMEVSAQGIEMRRADYVRFSCGLLTNICPDHLDFHGTFANYLAAKHEFLRLLRPSVPLVANWADPYCRSIAAQYEGPVVSISPDSKIPAAITAVPRLLSSSRSTFSLIIHQPFTTLTGKTVDNQTFAVTIPLPGLHNIENALIAAAAALLHDIRPAVITTALANCPEAERRFNIHHLHGCTVVDDTALNPGSIHAVYQTLRTFERRSLITVAAIRGNRGPAINYANALAFADWHYHNPGQLIITDSEDETTPADKVTPQERDAFLAGLEERKIAYSHLPALGDAIRLAAASMVQGDLIALLGAQGMDNGLALLRKELASHAAAKPIFSHPPTFFGPILQESLRTGRI